MFLLIQEGNYVTVIGRQQHKMQNLINDIRISLKKLKGRWIVLLLGFIAMIKEFGSRFCKQFLPQKT